jgi:hypothetical protein
MSERIKQLGKQAGEETSKEIQYLNNEIAWHMVFEQKFAKLIAIECMKICTDVKEDLFTIQDNDKRDLAEMAATFCYEAIKSEFGVEE